MGHWKATPFFSRTEKPTGEAGGVAHRGLTRSRIIRSYPSCHPRRHCPLQRGQNWSNHGQRGSERRFAFRRTNIFRQIAYENSAPITFRIIPQAILPVNCPAVFAHSPHLKLPRRAMGNGRRSSLCKRQGKGPVPSNPNERKSGSRRSRSSAIIASNAIALDPFYFPADGGRWGVGIPSRVRPPSSSALFSLRNEGVYFGNAECNCPGGG
jgi:hypothetical protein